MKGIAPFNVNAVTELQKKVFSRMNKPKPVDNLFLRGMRDGIPIALGYLAVSFTFGMMAVDGGLAPGQAVMISLLNLTSAGQFAGLDVILAGGPMLELILTQLVINLRYMLMSFSLSQKLDSSVTLPQRFLVGFGVTDEIFGVSSSFPGRVRAAYCYGLMAVAIPGWTVGTALGAAAGTVLPDFLMSALSVAIYGMFLAIIIPPARKDRAVLLVVLSSMALSCLFHYAPVLRQISTGIVIILVALLTSILAAVFRPLPEEGGAL